MIVAVNAIYAIGWRSLKKKIQDFKGTFARSRVQTPLKSWIIFQAFLRNCINCVHWDYHFFIFDSLLRCLILGILVLLFRCFFFPTCLYNNLSINEDLVKQLLLHVLIIDCWQTIEGYQTSFHNTRCGWIKASWPPKTRVFNVKTRAFRLTDTNFNKMCLSQQFCTLTNIHAIHFCSHCRFMLFINHMLLKNQWIIE